jgi:hypothetical protein
MAPEGTRNLTGTVPCGFTASALIEVGEDHRLADPESLAAMVRACERRAE